MVATSGILENVVINSDDPLDLSIQHWKDIISGADTLYSGVRSCAMCTEYFDNDLHYCNRCPLVGAKLGCNSQNSVWSRYSIFFWDLAAEGYLKGKHFYSGDQKIKTFKLSDLKDSDRTKILKRAKSMLELLEGFKDNES